MAYKYYKKVYEKTNCHIVEITPDDIHRVDVTLGTRNVLEKLSRINGEPKSDEKTIIKANGSFFNMSGKDGDTYSSFVDEGKFYHDYQYGYPTLIYWKSGYYAGKMTVENYPDNKRFQEMQEHAHWAIGSAWTLMLHGKVDYLFDVSTIQNKFGHATSRQPRTMIGQKEDGTIILVVTDGRVSGSLGLTIYMQSALMKSLGCYIAVNMDGGGSSEMIINNQIKNRLANGAERSIGTAFMVYEKLKSVAIPSTYLYKGRVNVNTLNVRNKNSTSRSSIIGTLSKDTIIYITERKGDWYKFTNNQFENMWVSAQYVTVESIETDDSKIMTTTANLNIRSGPRNTANKVGLIPKGSDVECLEYGSSWCKIRYNGIVGYSATPYLTIKI